MDSGPLHQPANESGRGGVPFDEIRWPVGDFVGAGGELRAAPMDTADAEVTHQTGDGATSDRVALTSQMLVQPARPITRVVRVGETPRSRR